MAVAAARGVPGPRLEADAHLGVANRLLAAVRDARLPELPDRGPGAAPLRASRGGRCRPRSSPPTPAEGREAFGLTRRRCRWCSSSAAARARRASTAPASTPSAARTLDLPARARLRAAQRRAGARGAGGTRASGLSATGWCPTLTTWPHAMAAADLVVARSGGSVAELAALGKPAILVPYPYATADHQRKNAPGWSPAARRSWWDDAELDGALLGAPGRRAARRPAAPGARWRRRARRWAGRTPRSAWPTRSRTIRDAETAKVEGQR